MKQQQIDEHRQQQLKQQLQKKKHEKTYIKKRDRIPQNQKGKTACIHSLKSSSTYAYLRDEFDCPHIASYSEIRWVSLHDAFKSLHKSHDSINIFYESDEDGKCTHKLEDKHWRFIESLLPMFKIYKSAIKLLESDEFGTISFVINSLHIWI